MDPDQTARAKALLERAAPHGIVDSASVLALLIERGEAAAARLETGQCSEAEAIQLRGDLALTVAALRVADYARSGAVVTSAATQASIDESTDQTG